MVKNLSCTNLSLGMSRCGHRLRVGSFVVGVFNDFSHDHVSELEPDRAINAGVSGKPIVTVNLLAIGHKHRLNILELTLLGVNSIGKALAASLYDLKIVAVPPNPPLKIAFISFKFLWFDMKDVSVEFVDALLP